MSSLIYRGRHVYLSVKRGTRWVNEATGISVDRPTKRNGRWVFPPEAWKFKEKVDLEVAFGVFGLEKPKRASATLSKLLSEFLAEKSTTIAPSTVKEYERAIGALMESVGDIPQVDLERAMVAEFRAGLLGKVQHNTAAKVMRHVRAVLEWGVEEREYARENAAKRLLLQPKRRIVRTYTRAELLSFFTTAQRVNPGLFNQCLFLLLTGARSGDSTRFSLDQVDYERRVFILRNRKADRDEVCPMDDTLTAFFSTLPQTYAPRAFKYWSIWSLGSAFQRVRKEARLPTELTMHQLKKTFLTGIADQNPDVRTLQALGHHTDVATTLLHYVASGDIERQRAVLAASRASVKDVLDLRKLRAV